MTPSVTHAKNAPADGGALLAELALHGLDLGVVGVLDVERLELALLVVEVGDGGRPQVAPSPPGPPRPARRLGSRARPFISSRATSQRPGHHLVLGIHLVEQRRG